MVRLKRSQALWIVRGMRLGKFLRCAAGVIGRYVEGVQPWRDSRIAETPRPRGLKGHAAAGGRTDRRLQSPG
jgi:hypothetical protein